MTDNIADAVEAELVALSGLLTEPVERECLRCFLLEDAQRVWLRWDSPLDGEVARPASAAGNGIGWQAGRARRML